MTSPSSLARVLRAASLAGALTLTGGAAFAQSSDDVSRAIARAEASIDLIREDAARSYAPTAYERASLRLEQAREAEDRRDRTEAYRRAEEASLQAQLAAARIETETLKATEGDVRDAVDALERELAATQ